MENQTINTTLISEWEAARQSLTTMQTIFNDTGNKFTFTKDSVSYDIHAYIGYDLTTEQLSFTIIKSSNDTDENTACLTIAEVNAEKSILPSFETVNENNPDAISEEEAKTRINNWIDNDVRNSWIESRFNEEDVNNAIFQVFVVHTDDLEYGVDHDCYLALKEEEGSYTADLIVVNSKTGVSNKNIEDLTAPVPPYQPITGRKKVDFGLLNTI